MSARNQRIVRIKVHSPLSAGRGTPRDTLPDDLLPFGANPEAWQAKQREQVQRTQRRKGELFEATTKNGPKRGNQKVKG